MCKNNILKNVAINKPITFTGEVDVYDDYKLQYVTDGILDKEHSYWGNSFQPVTFVIDLQNIYMIKLLNLKQFIPSNQDRGRCKDFVLSYSNNNINFIQCLKDTLPNDDKKIYSFKIDNIKARYWKFEILNNHKGWSNGLTELELMSDAFKYLIKQNNNYYSLKSSFYELGQPQDNNEKEQFYKENGIDDLNSLVEKKNGKSVNLKLDKNDIYKTVILINFNEITDKIEYIYKDNKKEIKYNTEKYQLLDLIKKSIGNKFQIGKWEEK